MPTLTYLKRKEIKGFGNGDTACDPVPRCLPSYSLASQISLALRHSTLDMLPYNNTLPSIIISLIRLKFWAHVQLLKAKTSGKWMPCVPLYEYGVLSTEFNIGERQLNGFCSINDMGSAIGWFKLLD